jgi:hypothetical protein
VQPSRPALSVSFHNFWRRFDAKDSFFVKALSQAFDVTVAEVGRDLQISSVFGTEPLRAKAGSRPLRVWWTGEARDPQSQVFDLHFGFRPSTAILGNRWHRFPLWVTYLDWWDEDSPYHVGRLLAPRMAEDRPRFCNFIFSSEPSIRTEFFLRLNQARSVDSVGKVLNNRGWRPPGKAGKMKVLGESTFTIAFENQIAPGYVTEKIVEPLLAGSIPIYWGAAEASTDFNPEAFIHAEDFASFDALVDHILQVADSQEALAALATASPFPDNRIAYEHTPDFFVERVCEALSGGPISDLPATPHGQWKRTPAIKKLEERIRRWRG